MFSTKLSSCLSTDSPGALRRVGRPYRRGSVTLWNVLALLTMIIGGLGTLGAGQLWLQHWSGTGVHVPVGGRYNVSLPHGRTVIFYESAVSVPDRNPMLKIRDSYGAWVKINPPADDNDYRLMFTGWSGRAVGEMTLDETGTYSVACTPSDFLDMNDVPSDDRIAMLKQPGSLVQANAIYKTILIVGATMTVLLTGGFYVLHFVALQRKKRRSGALT